MAIIQYIASTVVHRLLSTNIDLRMQYMDATVLMIFVHLATSNFIVSFFQNFGLTILFGVVDYITYY